MPDTQGAAVFEELTLFGGLLCSLEEASSNDSKELLKSLELAMEHVRAALVRTGTEV